MRDRLVRLFVVSRPVSWINTAYPFAAGYLVMGGGIDMRFILGTLFFLIPYNLLMYGVNDVFDYESDMRNPRKGGIEGAGAAKSYHGLILRASVVACAPFIVSLLLLGDAVSNIVLSFVLFMVIAYSLKGLRFKEVPILDSITSSVHFVGPLAYALALFGFPVAAWPYVAAFFLWGMASHAFGAVQDIVPDREGGLSSIATVLGARWTSRLSAGLYLLSCGLLVTASLAALPVALVGLLYVANCLPYLNLTDSDSGRANKAWRRFIWLNLVAGAVVTISLLYIVFV